jgi:hypothetical protein
MVKSWTQSRTRRTALDPVLGPIETGVAEAIASRGVVETVARYPFADSADVLTARTSLRPRSLTEPQEPLPERGFAVTDPYGAWDRGRGPIATRRSSSLHDGCRIGEHRLALLAQSDSAPGMRSASLPHGTAPSTGRCSVVNAAS